MKICNSVTEIQHELAAFDKEQIALVPTMGCLHEGHIALIRKARRLADVVVISIYVNPLQFGKNEDLDRYPRQFETDADTCRQEGVDFVFHPENLYPDGQPQVSLKVGDLSNRLCGIKRKGHFDGVATVVNILLNIVRPHIAVFGEKDFQQLVIIQRMVADLYMPVQIIAAETVRESDGLAKSSRNRYLNPQERKQAAAIFAAMRLMQDKAAPGVSVSTLLEAGKAHLVAQGLEVEYIDICHEADLNPVQTLEEQSLARIFIAARLGATRLIDNMPLHINHIEETSCKSPC